MEQPWKCVQLSLKWQLESLAQQKQNVLPLVLTRPLGCFASVDSATTGFPALV